MKTAASSGSPGVTAMSLAQLKVKSGDLSKRH